jgi:hypothetical protein
MKMPFFVYTNFFFDDILVSFYWRTGSGTDDTIAEDKSPIPISHHPQHACIRESASWSVFQRYGSLPLCPSHLQKVFGRRPVRIMYVRK